MALSNSDKRHLRGLAHTMDAIARIGSKRVTDGVIAHIDELLENRELIKVKLLDADREEVEEAGQARRRDRRGTRPDDRRDPRAVPPPGPRTGDPPAR